MYTKITSGDKCNVLERGLTYYTVQSSIILEILRVTWLKTIANIFNEVHVLWPIRMIDNTVKPEDQYQ